MAYLQSLFSDPRGTLIVILLALPARMLALSMHEYAHARMAYKCGDNTAYMLGRMTLNPFKHIDPLGFLMLYLVGFGWAKPVPINPRNFKGDVRRADFLVSIAGVATNFLMFLLGSVVLYAAIAFALSGLARVEGIADFLRAGENYIAISGGEAYAVLGGAAYPVEMLLQNAPSLGAYLIRPLWGDIPYYLFQMLSYFVQINIVLAIFNLIPIPPLDGYHVLNDLILKRDLFASQRAQMIGYAVMLALLFSGALGRMLGFVIEKAYLVMGTGANAIFSLLGIA